MARWPGSMAVWGPVLAAVLLLAACRSMSPPLPTGPRPGPPLPTGPGPGSPPLPTRLPPGDQPAVSEPGLGPAPEPVKVPVPEVVLDADEATLFDGLNERRAMQGQTTLATHGLLQQQAREQAAIWAARLGHDSKPAELDLDAFRKTMPEAFSLAWQVCAAPSLEGLLGYLYEAEMLFDPAVTHLGIGASEGAGGRTRVAYALVAHAVPPLTAEALDRGERLVHTTCSLCGESQYLELTLGVDDEAGTLNAICHKCGRKYDSFAQDTEGKFHRPSHYCEEFNPEPLDSAAKIWLRCLKRVDYEVDLDRYRRLDVWQRASQTWALRRGDCEDSALMIADWLRANGFDAKVVIGLAEGEGHAWVVLHADGIDYVLEGTGGPMNYHRVPPRAAAQPDYFPEAQFDPTGIWYRLGKAWTADYRDPEQWGAGPADP